MEAYDYIFAGTGVAAILLLEELLNSKFANSRILLLDQTTKEQNDRTLCYWESGPSSLDKLVYRYWDKVQIVSDKLSISDNILNYRYKCIKSIDLYNHMYKQLDNHPNIEIVKARVTEIIDKENVAEVVTKQSVFQAKYVFDSRFCINELNTESNYFLKQHFKGWFISTKIPSFNPNEMRMFDFRVPQDNDFRFCYLLPFTETEALVELVTLRETNFDATIKNYISKALKIDDYSITGYEGGVNPLTDRNFLRKGKRVVKVGTAGGLIKPSSGYGFKRMHNDAKMIVQSLNKNGHPFSIKNSTMFYKFCDALMLKVLTQKS